MDAFLVAVAAFAPAVTKATDFIRNLADPGGRAPKWVWNAVPFALGIGLALLWQVNLVGAIHGLPPTLEPHLHGSAGQVMTGIGIGAVASGWHELFDLLSSRAKANRAQAG
jgi:hypothetical protein